MPASAIPALVRTPGPVGTVDTIAGPGFCEGTARRDPDSARVGAVVTDPDGTLWFESGAPSTALVTKVVNSSDLSLVSTGFGTGDGEQRVGDGAARSTEARSAPGSLLATDGSGSMFTATRTALTRSGGGLEVVAGTLSPEGERSENNGDGGPLSAARFDHIAAIAGDGAGNVYVADVTDKRARTITIRFLNRSDAPITFHAGTPHARTVAAGTVATVAGGAGDEGTPGAGTLAGDGPSIGVRGDRLYVSATTHDNGRRGRVWLLNLGTTAFDAHGEEVPPGASVTVATVERARGSAAAGANQAVVGGLDVDDEGNLYVAELANHRVRRIDAAGVVSAFAGTGAAGFNGNDRPAGRARLDRPQDVAVGAGGRVYISDTGNDQVRVVDAAGTIRAALGNGMTSRWVCDPKPGGVRHAAALGSPASLAPASTGSVYLYAGGAQVHEITPAGVVRPVAGRPLACPDPDDCPQANSALTVELGSVAGVETGPGGLYVMSPSSVRYLNLSSEPVRVHGVTVEAGSLRTLEGIIEPRPEAQVETTPTGPAASDPYFHSGRPTAWASDGRGNLFLGELPSVKVFSVGFGRVRHLDPDGVASVALPPIGLNRDGSPKVEQCCSAAGGLVLDRDNNLYVADTFGRRVWFVNRSAVSVQVHGVTVAPGQTGVVAGTSERGASDEGGSAVDAKLPSPRGLALDADANLYIVDGEAESVFRVDRAGVLTTVVGTGQPGFNGDGLKGPLTALREPIDVAIDACGNLLVADYGNNRVRRLNLVSECPALASPVQRGGSGRGLPSFAGVALTGAALAAVAGAALATLVRRRRAAARNPG